MWYYLFIENTWELTLPKRLKSNWLNLQLIRNIYTTHTMRPTRQDTVCDCVWLCSKDSWRITCIKSKFGCQVSISMSLLVYRPSSWPSELDSETKIQRYSIQNQFWTFELQVKIFDTEFPSYRLAFKLPWFNSTLSKLTVQFCLNLLINFVFLQ